MGKKLVIVESPAKAKTIGKILGHDFVVKASMGHVRDLPLRKIGVDIEHGFAPQYVVVKGRERVVEELSKAAKGCEEVYLAPDPDREGEAIAWHLQALLAKCVPPESFRRVSYNEITPPAVRKAFAQPTQIDMRRVDAQQARRVLDRIVGYRVSPLLWSRISKGLSAGRVQSVALRLLCERELEIRGFVPQEYWVVGALVRKQTPPGDPFAIRLAKVRGEKPQIGTGEQAAQLLADLDRRQLRVARVIRRELSRRAPPPYITSTLQQAASRFAGFSPGRTMRIAQGLYEGVDLGEGSVGLITYMRTDSVNVSREAIGACRQFVEAAFGPAFVPEQANLFRSRKGAQEAHEAIRPTDVARTPDSLKGRLEPDALKVYRLIWQRFVASQMAPAKIDQRTVEIEAPLPDGTAAADYLFRATASQVAFPGYLAALEMEKPPKRAEDAEKEDEVEVESLPPLAEGEPLDRVDWQSERKETQPPGRYSEASLIRALEENGVGRPSTYAQIITTLSDRRYTKLEKKALLPTDLGMKVYQLLAATLNELFDVGFTARMEEQLDEIEEGKVGWTDMLASFYGRFEGWLKEARGPRADQARVAEMLALLGQVREWAPSVQQGKRLRGDREFVESVGRQLEEAEKPISERQHQALVRLVARYREQIPGSVRVLEEGGHSEVIREQEAAPQLVEAGRRKLALLETIEFEAPRERRGRVYDDGKFYRSLKARVDSGRPLSEAQEAALDKMLLRYAAKIPGFDAVKADLNLAGREPVRDERMGPLLEAMQAHVTQWREPTQKGARTMDDRLFVKSLADQFAARGTLTPRQVSALKRVARRYHEQIPDFDRLAGPDAPARGEAPAAPGSDGDGRT